MTTFADLGIPFPLFDASVDEASEYLGAGHCFACAGEQPHCFELGIGAALLLPCLSCGTANGLDADDGEDARCRSCGASVPFPEAEGETLAVCHACLRAGHAALTKDTTLGMVSWEEALDVTGVQSLHAHAHPSPKALLELLRTPGYISIQGERWELCCERPMIYLGQWTQDEFDAAAPDGDGQALFDEIVQEPEDGLWEDDLHDSAGIYVFRCGTCGRKTANWDVA
jgi:uncharacterized protein CbrC (UPF0167 family)